MRRIFIFCLVLLASGVCVEAASAGGQGYPNGQGYPGGGGMGGGMGGVGGHGAGGQPVIDPSSGQATEKPDKAAKKAYEAGLKSLKKAHEYEDEAAKQTNPDKKANLVDKIGDAYGKALDQFTEALSNKGDMVEAWNGAGYVHLRLGAFNEAIDDYNHTLTL
jgi:acyl-CoA reductase-like NAD-dependent aldehyde dehydrogenase